MVSILHIIQIVSAILLIVLVLMQRTSGDFGGAVTGMEGGSFMQTRRGSERFFFSFTVLTAVVFVGVSLASILVSR